MIDKYASALKSGFAQFGYETYDAWSASLMDVIGVLNDSALLPKNEACIVGNLGVDKFLGVPEGTVCIHNDVDDTYRFLDPVQIRLVFDKSTSAILNWDGTKWTSLGAVSNIVRVHEVVTVTAQILADKRFTLSNPVVGSIPSMYLMGCGPLLKSVHYTNSLTTVDISLLLGASTPLPLMVSDIITIDYYTSL